MGTPGDRAQYDGRVRHDEVGPVVLAQPEHVKSDLVGEFRLLNQVA